MFLLTNGNDTIDFKTAVTDILLKKNGKWWSSSFLKVRNLLVFKNVCSKC